MSSWISTFIPQHRCTHTQLSPSLSHTHTHTHTYTHRHIHTTKRMQEETKWMGRIKMVQPWTHTGKNSACTQGETKRREKLILESPLALQMMPIHSFIVISQSGCVLGTCTTLLSTNLVPWLRSQYFPQSTVLLASTGRTWFLIWLIN